MPGLFQNSKSGCFFDGVRWNPDYTGGILDHAGVVADEIIRSEAERDLSPDEKGQAMQRAARLGSRKRLEDAATLAQPMMATRLADFDSHPFLVGTPSGILDLRTGQAKAPDASMLITKSLGADPDPGAACTAWIAFLDRIFSGDSELIDFMQRSIGYSLAGDSTEHRLWFLYGSGANGKSTLVETILALLGSYGAKATNSLFCIDRHGREPESEIAALRGSRLVIGEELEDGAKLAEARVKGMTGGDTLRGRFLYGEPFDFSPTHAAWMFGNHKPRISGNDSGIWRRINLVPFTVSIPKAERDPELARKLRVELPGILQWAINGCLRWQSEGMTDPEVIREAVAEYRSNEDILAEFIEDETEDGEQVTKSELYLRYEVWAKGEGLNYPLTKMKLGSRLKERGWKEHRNGSARVWLGKQLKPVA